MFVCLDIDIQVVVIFWCDVIFVVFDMVCLVVLILELFLNLLLTYSVYRVIIK